MKVYCTNCKHHKWIEEYAMKQVCKLSMFTVDSAESQREEYIDCCVINDNNNCKDYEPKLRHKIFQKIFGSSPDPIENRFEIMDL